jgi:hypothetical protein
MYPAATAIPAMYCIEVVDQEIAMRLTLMRLTALHMTSFQGQPGQHGRASWN